MRLRKWVETEDVKLDVDLQRETAKVSREPLDEMVSGSEIGEEEIEMQLHREVVLVERGRDQQAGRDGSVSGFATSCARSGSRSKQTETVARES